MKTTKKIKWLYNILHKYWLAKKERRIKYSQTYFKSNFYTPYISRVLKPDKNSQTYLGQHRKKQNMHPSKGYRWCKLRSGLLFFSDSSKFFFFLKRMINFICSKYVWNKENYPNNEFMCTYNFQFFFIHLIRIKEQRLVRYILAK